MNEPIIKNIEINNFRRFKNFKGVSQPFNKFNLLYGWNYSGKTTLSNIFEIYSETFDKNVDEDIDFTLITTKGKLCIEDVEKIKTYVFNANYVDKNLFFESNATTNLIVVADKAKEIIEKINDLKKEREVLINDKGRNDNGDIVDVTKLYRGENELATNLSEGEKTAISFAHFYTKILNAINKNTAKDEILFIDDPISSLDKNHIYSISILIKEVIDKFNQTFITTHNFELYRLLDYKKSSTTLNHYYIRRMNEESIITELPEELQKHDTEYDFLFAILYKFKITGEGELFLIGHCLRRFMDNYLQYKIPNNLNPCDKLTKLIKHYKEDQVKYSALYRIANNESHSHPEIIFDKSYLLGAVDLLITFIENYDELHYETLMNCIE